MDKKEKNEKVDKLLKEMERKYSVHKASDIVVEPKIRTGVYALDYVLDGGISQFKGGHIMEFYGGESSGKTTFCLHVIKKYQSLDKTCAYINAEASYDPQWAEICGVDNSNLLVMVPESLENAGEMLFDLIPKVDLIVIDSISALVPEEEIDKTLSDKNMASQAKVNTPMCRKINKIRQNHKTSIIFINQLREKVGIMYGNPEHTPGGRALKHLYDTRVQFRAGKPIDIGSGDKKERIGMEINLYGKKNKKGQAFKRAILDFYTNGEVDNRKSLFFAAVKFNVINLTGKTYTFGDRKVVGKDNLIKELTPKEWEKIEKEIFKLSK